MAAFSPPHCGVAEEWGVRVGAHTRVIMLRTVHRSVCSTGTHKRVIVIPYTVSKFSI